MTNKIAVIGGSGFYTLDVATATTELPSIDTPYGAVGGLVECTVAGKSVVFLARHGGGHKVPPHQINYRANIFALKSLGVTNIIAANAVGGIGDSCGPGVLVIPDQILDFTYGRHATFFDCFDDEMSHIDFTYPFEGEARSALIKASNEFEREFGSKFIVRNGVYACMQGPRLETAAEIKKLKSDGASLVGMTVMPEAALAREKGIDYASVSLVVNWAAGLAAGPITLDAIKAELEGCVAKAEYLIGQSVNYF